MKKISMIILGCLMMVSCNPLDNFLNKAPQSDMSYVETVNDCNLLLNNPKLMFSLEHSILLDDAIVLADIEGPYRKNTSGYREYAYFSDGYIYLPSENDDCWNRIYANVYYMNVILDMIDKVAGDDEILRSQIKGEAYLNRALYHFSLVNIYAKQYNSSSSSTDPGIPIVDKADQNAKRSRATVDEVYRFVLSDIDKALEFLKEDQPNFPSNYRANLPGAYALKAKVLMNMQDWNGVIENVKKSLEFYDVLVDYNQFSDFNAYETTEPSMYNPYTNREAVWVKGQDNMGNGIMNRFIVDMSFIFGGLYLADDFVELLDTEADLRYKFFMGKNFLGQTTLKEFPNKDGMAYGSFNSGVNTPQLYLMLAEAYARSNKINEGLDVLNKFAKNRYLADKFVPYAATDASDLIAAITKESQIEGVYTGRRWLEMKRLFVLGEYDKVIVRYNKDGEEIGRMVPSLDRMVAPIPEKVISINPNIKPNAPIK